MKVREVKQSKTAPTEMDESLEKFRGKNLFPEQLAKVNAILAKSGLPKVKKA
ncbi:hypothetical protein DYBT9623_02950 [Dyadobacter sp. CECT 9623]|uniref:Uncharacterized protein n=1 Tax=Dyadobacter linearis TaxID=2823330 RepID=A0ABN7R850_9BACT|nr:hypothetical protein [Dyadobacter sp. CECT 9623]CAG5070210.1 hypothetical protein DYBT9623_02950 [Dyadobacter sp. CECT 9623]